jgi:hypothetical protein
LKNTCVSCRQNGRLNIREHPSSLETNRVRNWATKPGPAWTFAEKLGSHLTVHFNTQTPGLPQLLDKVKQLVDKEKMLSLRLVSPALIDGVTEGVVNVPNRPIVAIKNSTTKSELSRPNDIHATYVFKELTAEAFVDLNPEVRFP